MLKRIFSLLVVLLLGGLVASAQNREDLQKQKQSIEKELAELNPVSYTHLDVYKRQL